MLRRYRFGILAIITIIAFCALFLYTASRMGGREFTGTDTIGAAEISGMTGIPMEDYPPLVGQWIPPGAEVEAALFALQAAIGGICVGWVFGYWKGLKEKERERRSG